VKQVLERSKCHLGADWLAHGDKADANNRRHLMICILFKVLGAMM
jgi:hypothetical protein